VAVFLTAFAFGPWIGLVAGGVGTALADLFGGYAQFAVLTFLAHGLQGLVAGFIGGRNRGVGRMVLGWAAGAAVMLATYFVGEAFVFRLGVGVAVSEAVTINLLQVVVGGIVSVPLVLALRRAYPPIIHWGRPRA
jgi:energy-coupling factor transport system substrate-specific component